MKNIKTILGALAIVGAGVIGCSEEFPKTFETKLSQEEIPEGQAFENYNFYDAHINKAIKKFESKGIVYAWKSDLDGDGTEDLSIEIVKEGKNMAYMSPSLDILSDLVGNFPLERTWIRADYETLAWARLKNKWKAMKGGSQ